MNVMVTGGSGFVGQHLTAALLKAGHRVWCMYHRHAPTTISLHDKLTPVMADLRDRHAVVAACHGMDVVYHVGALSAPWGRRADFIAVNVDGTEHVVDGCLRASIKRLIFVSSPSVVFNGYDQTNLKETAPYPLRFASVYSATKKLAEDRVNAATRLGLCTVILRPKAIFGPGDTTLLPRLIAAARRGRLPQIGNGKNLVDLTYIDNVVHALMLAIEAPHVVGRTYTITNDEHIMLWDAIKMVLARLGLSNQLPVIPVMLALAIARLLEARAMVTGIEPMLTHYTAAILGRTQTYDICAAREELGYRPRISVAEGIEHTLLQMAGSSK